MSDDLPANTEMRMQKKTVWTSADFPHLDQMTFAQAIALLTEEAKKFPDTAKIDWQSNDYSDGYHYVVKVPRLETIDELDARLAAERKLWVETEARERAQFERLSKKFGGS